MYVLLLGNSRKTLVSLVSDVVVICFVHFYTSCMLLKLLDRMTFGKDTHKAPSNIVLDGSQFPMERDI